MSAAVAPCNPAFRTSLHRLFAPYCLHVANVAARGEIPGSYWGDSEAGLIGDTLFVRDDTPVHSALHEGCHYICMDAGRRARLDTDAGSDVAEENAVCYLQGLLADLLTGYCRQRLFADMDNWGYSFRLGSAQAWFEHDADDARDWLQAYDLIDDSGCPTVRLRE